VFDYIETYHNPTSKRTKTGMLSLVDYEAEQKKMDRAGDWQNMSTSALRYDAGIRSDRLPCQRTGT